MEAAPSAGGHRRLSRCLREDSSPNGKTQTAPWSFNEHHHGRKALALRLKSLVERGGEESASQGCRSHGRTGRGGRSLPVVLINLRQESDGADKKCFLMTWEEVHSLANEFLRGEHEVQRCVSVRVCVHTHAHALDGEPKVPWL